MTQLKFCTTVTWSVLKSDWYWQLQCSGSQQFELGEVARPFFLINGLGTRLPGVRLHVRCMDFQLYTYTKADLTAHRSFLVQLGYQLHLHSSWSSMQLWSTCTYHYLMYMPQLLLKGFWWMWSCVYSFYSFILSVPTQDQVLGSHLHLCPSWHKNGLEVHRDPAGNRAPELPIASRMLLPLSHWTHGRGAEASLLITAMLEGTADSSCLSLSHHRILPELWMEIRGGSGYGSEVDWLYRHISWVDTLTIHHPSLRLNYLSTCSISGTEGKF